MSACNINDFSASILHYVCIFLKSLYNLEHVCFFTYYIWHYPWFFHLLQLLCLHILYNNLLHLTLCLHIPYTNILHLTLCLLFCISICCIFHSLPYRISICILHCHYSLYTSITSDIMSAILYIHPLHLTLCLLFYIHPLHLIFSNPSILHLIWIIYSIQYQHFFVVLTCIPSYIDSRWFSPVGSIFRRTELLLYYPYLFPISKF